MIMMITDQKIFLRQQIKRPLKKVLWIFKDDTMNLSLLLMGIFQNMQSKLKL